MFYHLDTKLKGHVMIYDSPLELVTMSRENNQGPNPFQKARVNYPGRRADNWNQIEKFLHTPWPEAGGLVQGMIDGIKRSPLPAIESIRRRPSWSEDDGEVEVDRVMRGDSDYYRTTKRKKMVTTSNITIVTNLDFTNNVNPTGVFFRSAVAIALADILEDMGYSVEIWVWCLGWYVYPNPTHKQFTAVRPKKFGEPVDTHALCDTLSAWFAEVAIFGSFMNCPVKPVKHGAAVEPGTEGLPIWETPLAPWAHYLELNRESKILTVPMVRGWSQQHGIDRGAAAAKLMLDKVNDEDWGG